MKHGLGIEARIDHYTMPEPMSGCHLWTGGLSNGYPALTGVGRISRYRLGRKLGRPLLAREKARHKCDNPICVNPDHLEPGSHGDNMADMWRRKPPRRVGEGVGKAKLTEAQVLEIRASSDSLRKLGRRYGVASCTIYNAKSGNTWQYLPMAAR